MADGKNISTKFRELLVANTVIATNVGSQIFYGDQHPIGNLFPQIVYSFEDFGSEQMFPARRGRLSVWIWVDKDQAPSPKNMLEILYEAINGEINRNLGQPFDEINIPSNEGLRVVKCLKTNADDGYDKIKQKYYYEIEYSIVMSEGESFAAADDGGKAWVN